MNICAYSVLTTGEGNIYRRSHMTGVAPQSRDQIAKRKSLKTLLQYKGPHIGIYLVVSFSFFSSL